MLRTLKYTVIVIGLVLLVGASFGGGFGVARFTGATPVAAPAPQNDSPEYF